MSSFLYIVGMPLVAAATAGLRLIVWCNRTATHSLGDLLLRQTLGAQQNDLRTPAVAQRHCAGANPAPQFPASSGCNSIR
jgi:hypothetical protein